MGRYLLLWDMDMSRVPVSPQERAAGWSMLTGMVREDMAKGALKDWGSFVGELKGYAVAEGTEVEIGSFIQRYVPYVSFKTHAVGTVSQVEEIIRTLTG